MANKSDKQNNIDGDQHVPKTLVIKITWHGPSISCATIANKTLFPSKFILVYTEYKIQDTRYKKFIIHVIYKGTYEM